MTGIEVRRDGRLLHVTVTGRATGPVVESFADTLRAAAAEPGPLLVLFDRRAMTAPTEEGRSALERWPAEVLPVLAGRCTGWADVFDERRAASLARAGTRHEPGPYPQRTFSDPAAARDWLLSTAGPSERNPDA
jgi:hypothetical protein